jgi:hypothetical protein
MEAIIKNWPIGSKRTTATFRIETHPTRGQRGTRFTIDPKTGKPSATKRLPYATQVRIVDGDDGRTYLLEYSADYDVITVMRSDMRVQQEIVWPSNERFAAMKAQVVTDPI